MQSEIDIADVLLDYSDMVDLDIYLPKETELIRGVSSSFPDMLPNFPYLPDSAIRELKLSELYEALSATCATNEEVELLRVRRRKLQKSHFKQKYDKRGRVAFRELERSLEQLSEEKEELLKLKSKLQRELEFYRDSLDMEL